MSSSSKRVTRGSSTSGGGGGGEEQNSSSKRPRNEDPSSGMEGHQVVPRSNSRPLVTLLEGKDCSVEMPILKDVSTVAFCDATRPDEIHDKVLNDAWGVFLWDKIRLTGETLAKFRSLKIIIKIGPGMDNIDVDAAANMGIAVCNVNGYGIEEAADTAIGVILNLYRKINWFDKKVKDGSEYRTIEDVVEGGGECTSIRGRTLGLVGLGRVGVAVALRAKEFGFNVIFFDPYLDDGIEKSYGVTRVSSMGDLLSHSDCISLHCGLQGVESFILNEYTISLMRPGAFLVNVANTSLVDEVAVINALKEKRLKGAALATAGCKEAQSRLKDVDNLICIPYPHSAFLSETSRAEFREAAATEMRRAIVDGIPGTLRYLANNKNLNGAGRRFPTAALLPPGMITPFPDVNFAAAAYAALAVVQAQSSRTSPDSASNKNNWDD
ncbi:unnamed protein product [Orchesella dallaii]|uniref:C-terminal-binding protein n=1 Tax=Orchesella dallaii TaxID=48710 RepID=A0ABP1Q7S8_9HEXA